MAEVVASPAHKKGGRYMAFLDENGLAELWSLIQTEDDAVRSLANEKVKIVTGSYAGTDKYGSSNPSSLTFDFVPQIVIMIAYVYTSNGVFTSMTRDSGETLMVQSLLTTSFQEKRGFGGPNGVEYGKRSADGKTIYWYNTDSAFYQYNSKGYVYHYVAIG